jgi:hypothetical protein
MKEKPLTAIQFLTRLHEVCHFQTKEGSKVGRASGSELRRWIQNGAFLLNTERVEVNEPIDFPIFSIVLFPNSKRVTLL